MARRAKLNNAFPRGVLDPDLYERIDLAHYYLAVGDARNQVASPQGGLERRPATVASGQRLRRRIQPVTLTAGMITAPEGGTIANLIDQDAATLFTTAVVDATTFELAVIDLGTPRAIAFVDVIAFRSASAVRDDCLAVEWWDGAAWQPFGASADPSLSSLLSIRTTARTRRFGTAPGAQPTAQLFRIAIRTDFFGQFGLGAITIGGLKFWTEQDVLSPVEIVPFAKTSAETYELVIGDRNIDVFRNGIYAASISIMHGAELIDSITWAQSLDTLLLFHQEVTTTQIVRQGAHDEWNPGAATFTNVPALTASTAFSGDQDEMQEFVFEGLDAGDTFIIFMGDLRTGEITYSTDETLRIDIGAAIEALPGVNANNVEVTIRSSDPLTLRVAFVTNNGARRWPLLSPLVTQGDATISVSVVQAGLDADGPLMGANTGWPSCGVFNQARLLLAGFRAAPSTYAFSRVAGYFDFLNTGNPVTADLAIIASLDSDKVESIRRLFVGQHLHLFTEEGEWFLENRVIDATQPLNFVLSTGYGIAANIAPIFVQGGTLFVQFGGEADGVRQPDRVVRDMIFDFADRNSYTAEPISLLGPHLLTDIIDLAHRPGARRNEASLVMMLNAAGDFVLLTLLRSQEVIAMTPCDTGGDRVAAIGTDKKRNIWLAVEREVGGTPDLWLERLDDHALLDAQVTITGAPSTTIENLDHLEGRDDVWVFADGDIAGPFTVTGATIELDEPASEKIVGIAVPIEGRTLPLREQLQQAQPFRPPGRIYMTEWSMRDCGPFEMRANGSAWREVAIRHFDGGPIPKEATGEEPNGNLDTPLLQRLYSGRMKVEGLTGWTRDCLIEWRQLTPAPFKIRGVRYEVSY